MLLTLYIIVIITSTLILAEDCRTRSITVWKIALLFLSNCALLFFSETDALSILKTACVNFCIVLIFYAGLVVFYFLKEGRLILSLKNKVGLGDGLLFLVPVVSFDTLYFLYFILMALFFSFISLIWQRINKKEEVQTTIPLAGIMAALFAVCLVLMDYNEVNRFDSTSLFEHFILSEK